MIDIDGQPWFVAADVCRVLGLPTERGTFMHLKKLDADEKQPVTPNLVGGHGPSVTTISEPGLYKLIQSSNKPAAKAFDRWVRHEVLPVIRKDGGYIQGEEMVKTGTFKG